MLVFAGTCRINHRQHCPGEVWIESSQDLQSHQGKGPCGRITAPKSGKFALWEKVAGTVYETSNGIIAGNGMILGLE